MNEHGKTALITGASGGIGHELAKLFAHDRYDLVLVARDAAKLTQFSDELQRQFGIAARFVALDLTETSAPQALFDQLQSDGIAIDFLVNNAGYGKFGEFATMPLADIVGQVALNIASLTALTRLLVPSMIKRGSGRIMNVASTAGFQPGPLMAVYYATKAYVISFSEAIANELKGTGVTVTCFCPGATDTGFAARAGNDKTRLFQKFGAMNAKRVARDGYRGLMKGKSLVISGLKNWMVAESVRFAPRKMVTAISRWITEEAK
jgi:uncharacterized protein